jgi:hypothetical protein
MAQSIFLGPQYSGTAADTPRAIEEKLNSDFRALFAANPALAGQREQLRITVSSDNGERDSVPELEAKINRMIKALNAQGGLSLQPVQLDRTRREYGGITPQVANQLTNALAALGNVASLTALGLSTTAVTAGQAFTANITGATATSTLQASGLPTGLTLNSGARTITGTTNVAAGSYPITLTETLAGKWGSPRSTNFTLVVS